MTPSQYTSVVPDSAAATWLTAYESTATRSVCHVSYCVSHFGASPGQVGTNSMLSARGASFHIGSAVPGAAAGTKTPVTSYTTVPSGGFSSPMEALRSDIFWLND